MDKKLQKYISNRLNLEIITFYHCQISLFNDDQINQFDGFLIL